MNIALKSIGTSLAGCNTYHTLSVNTTFAVLMVAIIIADLRMGQARKISDIA
jgi:hypothetical protein